MGINVEGAIMQQTRVTLNGQRLNIAMETGCSHSGQAADSFAWRTTSDTAVGPRVYNFTDRRRSTMSLIDGSGRTAFKQQNARIFKKPAPSLQYITHCHKIFWSRIQVAAPPTHLCNFHKWNCILVRLNIKRNFCGILVEWPNEV